MSELERALVALGRELAVPEAPGSRAARAPRARAARSAGAPARRGRARAPSSSRWLLAALAVPDARSALAPLLPYRRGAHRGRGRAASGRAAACRSSISSSRSASACRWRRRGGVPGYDLLELDEAPGSRLPRARATRCGSCTGAPTRSGCSSRRRRELRVDEAVHPEEARRARARTSSRQRCAGGRRTS